MIATIATVTLAASAAANPVVGGFTQGLGEPCDMALYCQQGMQCTTGLFGTDGTGKCIDASESSAAIPTATIGYTQSLGEPCDMVSHCKSGLQCTTSLFGTYGTGMCIDSSSLPAHANRKLDEFNFSGKGDMVIGDYGGCDFNGMDMQGTTITKTVDGKCVIVKIHPKSDDNLSTAEIAEIAGTSVGCFAVVAAVALVVVKFNKKATEPELPVVVCTSVCGV